MRQNHNLNIQLTFHSYVVSQQYGPQVGNRALGFVLVAGQAPPEGGGCLVRWYYHCQVRAEILTAAFQELDHSNT